MKKIVSKILGCTIALTALTSCFTGCGGSTSKWTEPTLVNWGEAVASANGGFVSETENYIYYLNGIPNSTHDNKFGTPIKGSLMVMDKADPSKTEIVVPKLFAASDYNAGVFVWDGYAYYGTPNTDKAPDGSTANDELVFERTGLDGKNNERLLVASNDLATEYRIVKNGKNVYITYYDAKDTALKVYDVNAGETKVIAKTDEKSEGNYSLAEYKFINDENGEIALAYTLSVFSEPYLEDKAETDGYKRATQGYNVMMIYKAGDEADQTTETLGKVVLNGESSVENYTFAYAKGDKVFFTATTLTGSSKTYGGEISAFYANGERVEIINTAYLTDTTIIKSFEEVYTIESGCVCKTTLVEDDKATKEVIAIANGATKVFEVLDGQVYYLNESNEIVRKEINNEDAKVVRVSEGIAFTGWFAPEIVTINGKTYMFYIDDSDIGLAYTTYVDIGSTAVVEEKDKDDDGEADVYYLGGQNFVGIKTEQDKASIVGGYIARVGSSVDSTGAFDLKLDDDGKLYSEELNKAIEEYEKLTDETKELVAEERIESFNQYKKAVEMANVYNRLEGMYGYANKSEEDQAAVKAIYDEVKGTIKAFIDSDEYEVVQKYIPTKYKFYYSEAIKKFNKA